MPCLNGALTLMASLDSILGQTLEDLEVIVFDDGSTDGSFPLARSIADRDGRVRVIKWSHVGIVEALQRGCAEARGEFIARMDADDIAHPDRLAKQVALMRANESLGLCGCLVEQFGEGIGPGRRRYEEWINDLVSHEAIARDLFVECPVAHPTFFMRRAAFEEVGGYEDRDWPEDYDLLMRIHCAGYTFGKVPEYLLRWRHDDDRLSMQDARYAPERFRALKRHYLARTHLAGRDGFHQWGAGEVGKDWLQEWGEVKPEAVVDINPRKFGKTIHGARVIPPEELPGPGETMTLVAVGAPGARAEIRAWFGERGYTELADYVFVA